MTWWTSVKRYTPLSVVITLNRDGRPASKSKGVTSDSYEAWSSRSVVASLSTSTVESGSRYITGTPSASVVITAESTG